VPVDVRVLASTNRDLAVEIRAGRFREDLYYRLNVFSIQLPALRERSEDIPILVEHFLQRLTPPEGKKLNGVEADCLETLKAYSWPGNVRQLRNVIERALIVCPGPMITGADLPQELSVSAPTRVSTEEVRMGMSLSEVKRQLVLQTLKTTGGNKAKAAQILGVSLKTLYNHLKYHQRESRFAGAPDEYHS